MAVGKTTVTAKKGEFSHTIPVTVIKEDPAQLEYDHTAELLRDFLDLRFGMFLHFNSSTYEFADIGGDWAGENRNSTFDPKDWNPSAIDCSAWAKAAKSAGMTFAVLTTKHHDGFNLWDSAYTDYDVGSAAYQEDVVKLFTDACREEGIRPGLYFSMLDIKHKITSGSCTLNDVEFIKAQLRELMTNYGEIPFIIFDAWNAYWGGPNYTPIPYAEIVNLVHTYQPNCLVINISCEANSVRSQVAMFESAAGQSVPDWFDSVNISCNTPTSHWFWCTKYNSETFKTADWVLNENVNKFRDSDTVFILNVSPNQKGQLIRKYTDLLSEIGKKYQKPGDVEALPDRYLSDYDYHNNLLFHKVTTTGSSSGNAVSDRAVDGFCDFDFSHETATKSGNSNVFWTGDIGYPAPLGKLHIHVSSDMAAGALDRVYVYLLKENPGRATYARLEKADVVKKLSLTQGEKTENCYTLDLEGAEGRYIAIALAGTGELSLSEVVANLQGIGADSAYSLREKFATQNYTVGGTLSLPENGLFVTKNGGLVREAIAWNMADADLTHTGLVTVTGTSESGCFVELSLRIQAAGRYVPVPCTGVTASSMWSQAESLGWAHVRNLINQSGLAVNARDIRFSTHDNPYNGTSMWHSREGQTTAWLIFDLGKTTSVTNALIWNHNQLNEADRGVKTMKVYYTDKANPSDADWILVDTFTLHAAGAVPAQGATDFLTLGRLNARKIKFELLENFGDDSVIGLSEVMFFAGQQEGSPDRLALNAALSSFEGLSFFDYDQNAYAKAEEAYRKAVKAADAASQKEIDDSTAALESAMEALAAGYRPKTLTGLSSYVITLKVGEKLPATVILRFTDSSTQTATVEWEAVPASKLSGPGSFTVNGWITGTPCTLTASVVIQGVSDCSLAHLVQTYEALDTAGFTQESQAALAAALAHAKEVLADGERTQESVDSAKAALTAARYALAPVNAPAEKPDPVPDTSTGSTTENSPSSESTPSTEGTPDSTGEPSQTTSEPDPGKPGDESKNSRLAVWLGMGGLLVLATGAAVTVILVKKKKANEKEN